MEPGLIFALSISLLVFVGLIVRTIQLEMARSELREHAGMFPKLLDGGKTIQLDETLFAHIDECGEVVEGRYLNSTLVNEALKIVDNSNCFLSEEAKILAEEVRRLRQLVVEIPGGMMSIKMEPSK